MVKRRLREIVASVALLLVTGVAVVGSPAQASACGADDYPTSGALATHQDNNTYMATFSFELTQQQVSNLRCVANYLEIDFHLQGFLVPSEWDGYAVYKTNLPGAIHDVAASDFDPLESVPAVTRINTRQINPGIVYYATLTWANTPFGYPVNVAPIVGVTQSVSITWVPSYWANDSIDRNQKILCDATRTWAPFGDAWCIFDIHNENVRLWGDVTGLPQGRLQFDGSNIHRFGTWANTQNPPASMVPYLSMNFSTVPLLNLLPLPPTLTPTQGVTVSPAGSLRAFQPFSFAYKVKNTSGDAASIQRLVVAVRGPAGDALDVPCTGGAGVTLQPNQEFTCNASLPTGFGSQGQFVYWPDWLGYDGSWHAGQLGPVGYLTLGAPYQLSVAQPVSVGPSDRVAMLTPVNWSYRIRNTSGVPASVQRFVVAVRGPAGDALDVPCDNGQGVSLAPNQEWTCNANLPTGYGSQGTFTFWADWLDYNGQWHQGQLGSSKTLALGPAPTLYPVQPISVGPSDRVPKLSHVWWSYRVRNTSGSWASIQRLVVAVRGPAGDALDIPCANGNGVTLAPGEEWTCFADLPTGYGSTGPFRFWPDWMGYDGRWHTGDLGPAKVLTLY